MLGVMAISGWTTSASLSTTLTLEHLLVERPASGGILMATRAPCS